MRPRLEVHGFRTVLGRRMTLLFVAAAVLPAGWLGLVAYRRISEQLTDQAQERVRALTGSAGTALLDRLRLAEMELEIGARVLESEPEGAAALPPFRVLSGVVLNPTPAAGDTVGRWRLVTRAAGGGGSPRILLGHRRPGRKGWVWGVLDADSLVAAARIHVEAPAALGFCLLPAKGPPIACDSALLRDGIPAVVAGRAGDAVSGQTVVHRPDGGLARVGYWRLFLRGRYDAAPWTVVTAMDERALMASAAEFRWLFPRILIIALALVLLVTSDQIRRNLQPLEALDDASRRIGDGDLEARVNVHSRDEFGAVARAFNRMAGQLRRQFRSLDALRGLDEAVLAHPSRATVADAVLDRAGLVVPADAVALRLPGARAGEAVVHAARTGNASGKHVEHVRVEDGGGAAAVRVDREAPAWARDIPPFGVEGYASFLTVALGPGGAQGWLLLAAADPDAFDDAARPAVLQLAEQVTLALSLVDGMERLEQTQAGALAALSRSIDLASPWTAGHAERVAALSVALGRELGVDAEALDRLERAALLHDIGKIGVPPGIAERAGRLTPPEEEKLQEHVRLGTRVLEPIAAFSDIVPIVAQHHERWDGRGYPIGLAGHAIDPLARILAVANAFDALTSDLPDREGLNARAALERMRAKAGTEHDPAVVAALEAVLRFTAPAAAPAAAGGA